jgi:hypothetical protein
MAGTITYPGGRTEEFEATQREWVKWELWASRHGLDPQPDKALPMVMMRYLGFAAHYRDTPPAEWPPFEEWAAEDATLEVPEDESGAPVVAAATAFPAGRSGG